MNDPLVNAFLGGMVTLGFLAAGLFFVRFWRRSRDPLFMAFAAAFWLMALNQAIVTLAPESERTKSWFYLLRVAAFVLIAAAIIYKNAGGSKAE